MQIFDRSKALTGQLLTFAKGGEPVKKNGSIAKTLIDITAFLMKDSEHTYEFSFPDDLRRCSYDHEQISDALENIITNAIQAMPAGGSLHVSAENAHIPEKKDTYLKPGNYVKISIKDSGTGIPGEIIPKIFDPFFTTKKRCKGMGLATSHSIITKHQGCIDVNSSPGKGTDFYIYLPATEGKTEMKPVKKQYAKTGNGSILLMDDEVFIRETVGEMLKIMGYEVYKATDGTEAIKIIKEGLTSGINFKAFILDLTIPNGIGGKETISMLRQMGIETPAFASSGYSDDPVISSPADFGFTDSLRKPYRMEDLASMLGYYLKNKPD
jgi:CheY-like chemotaxis protein